jgi:metal-responsive CopG/Arc/MetJ family transcriptional regulator
MSNHKNTTKRKTLARITICLSRLLLTKIDHVRDGIPRSRIIARILADFLGKSTKNKHNEGENHV